MSAELEVLAPIDHVVEAFGAGFAPETKRTVSEWADAFRMLSNKSSPAAGRWRTDRTPYLREIMDHLSVAHPCRRVIFQKGAQVGATECGNNFLGYIIDDSPGPVLMVYPTLDEAKKASKTRIAPMIEETPRLRALVSDPRARDSGNTLLTKEFRGGVFVLTGANSGAGLRMMPIRFLFCDEVDEYPDDVDGQGDPISLAVKRTQNFREKIFLASTPTKKGKSRIEREYLLTDQRRYFVPCPHCAHYDWIRWENIRWEGNDASSVHLVCIACAGKIYEPQHKRDMLARGEWRATAVSSSGAVGFHLSALYSPRGWKTWASCVEEFNEALQDVPKMVAWVNLTLGETFEERGDAADPDAIMARCETYPAEVPAGVGVLVAAVDVQDDRLEYQIVGFGSGEESWLIQHEQLFGDPAGTQVWQDLDRALRAKFTHESGQLLAVRRAVIDSGGHHTDEVYRYAKLRRARGFYAIRGGNTTDEPLIGQPSYKNRYRIPVFTLCTDTGKATVQARLRIAKTGPGRIHLPSGISPEYVEQLVSEVVTWKWRPRQGSIRIWKKIRDRNEAFDLMVYSLAALRMLGEAFVRALPEEAARLAAPPASAAARAPGAPAAGDPEGPQPQAPAPAPASRPAASKRRGKGWIGGW
jgi:phage terminase large subunit GpA-like protein